MGGVRTHRSFATEMLLRYTQRRISCVPWALVVRSGDTKYLLRTVNGESSCADTQRRATGLLRTVLLVTLILRIGGGSIALTCFITLYTIILMGDVAAAVTNFTVCIRHPTPLFSLNTLGPAQAKHTETSSS